VSPFDWVGVSFLVLVLLLCLIFVLLLATGFVMHLFDVQRYEVRNWWEERRLRRAVKRALRRSKDSELQSPELEDALAALRNFRPRTSNRRMDW